MNIRAGLRSAAIVILLAGASFATLPAGQAIAGVPKVILAEEFGHVL